MMRRVVSGLATSGSLVVAAALTSACHPDVEDCRYDWYDCSGFIGGICERDVDCTEGFCCDTDNCGGGMCTYSCEDDVDCPATMACEHGVCFYMCDSDADCAVGWGCEHHNTICEWR